MRGVGLTRSVQREDAVHRFPGLGPSYTWHPCIVCISAFGPRGSQSEDWVYLPWLPLGYEILLEIPFEPERHSNVRVTVG